jgi:hypothetical protein
MERIGKVQLDSVLLITVMPSEKRLSDSDGQALTGLILQMADRYPSQDLTDSMEGYLWDFQQLAMRYSLPKVTEALAELRIRPGQSFFPRPDEVAGEIEYQRAKTQIILEREFQRRRRENEIAEFWEWAPEWMKMTGYDEEELLKRFPSYKGTKP